MYVVCLLYAYVDVYKTYEDDGVCVYIMQKPRGLKAMGNMESDSE